MIFFFLISNYKCVVYALVVDLRSNYFLGTSSLALHLENVGLTKTWDLTNYNPQS